MKIKCKNSGKIYDLQIQRSGENRMPCPECAEDRKKKTAKPFSFNKSQGVGKCQHCGAVFFEYRENYKQKEYRIPEWKNRTELTDNAAKYLRTRLILDDTLNAMNISSAVEFMPQTGREENVICFPYYRSGKLVNVKYRDARKNFKLVKDAELILYNVDSLQGESTAVIVEGEIDCLSFIQAGVKNVVSVPNGAGGNLDYLDNCYEELASLEKIIIAVDNDEAGRHLRDELIRRFGAEKCAVLAYGEKKDANEFLQAYGQSELRLNLNNAKDVPIDGVFSAEVYFDEIIKLWRNGLQPGISIGLPDLDKIVTWEAGRLAVVTGIPGHGKSEIIDQVVCMLNVMHGMKVAYFSPENHPLQYHYSKIASKISGKTFSEKFMNKEEFFEIYNYINENFFFINPEEDVTIETIIEKARYLVRKKGIKILVIDPYNKLEHLSNAGESETQYISRFLDKLTNFARIHSVLVFLIAHPRKMQQKKDKPGIFEVPTLYDINGSANFFNKCDYGITVYRNREENTVSIHVQKVKFRHWGTTGEAIFMYNSINGRIYGENEMANFDSYLRPQAEIQYEINLTQDEEVPF
jgi:twinkle protein